MGIEQRVERDEQMEALVGIIEVRICDFSNFYKVVTEGVAVHEKGVGGSDGISFVYHVRKQRFSIRRVVGDIV